MAATDALTNKKFDVKDLGSPQQISQIDDVKVQNGERQTNSGSGAPNNSADEITQNQVQLGKANPLPTFEETIIHSGEINSPLYIHPSYYGDDWGGGNISSVSPESYIPPLSGLKAIVGIAAIRHVATRTASSVTWKGFSRGKLKTHYEKHVLKQGEFGNISQAEYLKRAKSFSQESGNFNEASVGSFIIKHDPLSGRVFVGNAKSREIRTFYIDDGRNADAFQTAVDFAKRL